MNEIISQNTHDGEHNIKPNSAGFSNCGGRSSKYPDLYQAYFNKLENLGEEN